MLRDVINWIWGMMVLFGMMGVAMFSVYLIIASLGWIVTHLFEIMVFGIMCAIIVFIIAIVKHIWEVLTDEER